MVKFSTKSIIRNHFDNIHTVCRMNRQYFYNVDNVDLHPYHKARNLRSNASDAE